MGHVRKDIAVPLHSDNILTETAADVNTNLQYLRQKSENFSARLPGLLYSFAQAEKKYSFSLQRILKVSRHFLHGLPSGERRLFKCSARRLSIRRCFILFTILCHAAPYFFRLSAAAAYADFMQAKPYRPVPPFLSGF